MAKANKNSGDALVVLPEKPELLVESKETADGTLKRYVVQAKVQIEPEDLVEYGSKFPKVTEAMVDTFNRLVHCGTPSTMGKVFGEINKEHRKKNPAKGGKYKGKVLFFEEYVQTVTRADGKKVKMKAVRQVGGEPKYSNAALKQLRNLVTTMMQERSLGIDMKHVGDLFRKNHYVCNKVQLSGAAIKVEGNRPAKIANALAKVEREEKQDAIGEASKKHMEKVTAKANARELVPA